jgi:hypothetical protein
MQLKVSFDVVN